MAQKRDIRIASPRGYVYTAANKNGDVTARIQWAPGFAQRKKASFTKAQEFVDSECLRYMNPLTPRRTGAMIKSATLGYLAPYARRQYYEHKEKAHWFETMKASRKETILKGANKIAGQ